LTDGEEGTCLKPRKKRREGGTAFLDLHRETKKERVKSRRLWPNEGREDLKRWEREYGPRVKGGSLG